MKLAAVQTDRACGALLASAAGDALGAGYEFGPPLGDDALVLMSGGGGFRWAPGEWTDDTAMAVAIAEVAADGLDLRDEAAQSRIVGRWVEWSRTATDVGVQTREVLAGLAADAGQARAAARAVHERTGRSGGSGSLMRTAPVALAYLDDEDALAEAAPAISALTHFDPEAGEACLLWCFAIRHAVLNGELNVRVGLDRLPSQRRAVWLDRIEVAERSRPSNFANNGWVVEALQGAWSAIAGTRVPADDPRAGVFRADHLRLTLEAAVRGGRDTDTVAAIAGALLGATYGASAVPWQWRRVLHGWPGLRARELVALASRIARGGAPDAFDFGYANYPPVGVLGRHPYDEGVWLGGVAGLRDLPPEVDAIVSLCRVEPPPGVEVVESRLIDAAGANAHLDFALLDAVRAVEGLRAEGRVVYLHCVAAQSRTPAVAALYGMRARNVHAESALADLRPVLPQGEPNADFRAALDRAGSAG